jgi:hypothetical protein
MADFDYKKFLIENKLKIRVPMKEMARLAKEKYKLNPEFPGIKDRISKPDTFKVDRKQQVINYFIAQAKEQGVEPMEVELLKSDIEKKSAPGINWSFTPDIRNQLLQTTTAKTATAADEEPEEVKEDEEPEVFSVPVKQVDEDIAVSEDEEDIKPKPKAKGKGKK